MGKKSSSKIAIIYLIGMALVALGFILPMFKSSLGTSNGFDFIRFKDGSGNFKISLVTLAAILIFCGAVLGIVFCFVGGKNADLLKLVFLIVSIVGGILLIIRYNDNWLTKAIGKGFWKHAYYGTYMILAGWVVGLVGWVTKK